MIIWHTSGIRRYLKKGIIYTNIIATYDIRKSILNSTKTLLKSIKRI